MTRIRSRSEVELAAVRASVAARYRGELQRYFAGRLYHEDDVEDLIQDVCIRFVRLREDKLIQEPLAYLYGIAARVLAKFVVERSREREYLIVNSDLLENWSTRLGSALEPQVFDVIAWRQRILWCLIQLPPTHAAVLLYRERDGMTYEEVAAKLQLSVHTVEKYLTQAKGHLRALSASGDIVGRRPFLGQMRKGRRCESSPLPQNRNGW